MRQISGPPLERWVDRAACAGAEPEWFMPPTVEMSGREASIDLRLAASRCSMCEVRTQCLTWAVTQRPHVVGIWGGVLFPSESGASNTDLVAELEHPEFWAGWRARHEQKRWQSGYVDRKRQGGDAA